MWVARGRGCWTWEVNDGVGKKDEPLTPSCEWNPIYKEDNNLIIHKENNTIFNPDVHHDLEPQQQHLTSTHISSDSEMLADKIGVGEFPSVLIWTLIEMTDDRRKHVLYSRLQASRGGYMWDGKWYIWRLLM